ncbi:MAG TPA: ergothioneine biosynthesis protein EgtB [Verrucomicrobiae bacterium]|jgi:ergothioneine biosynthesis protein EgtB|nr:ergothioneine biosynthesis protein EgtB [Verrucomicrobiae bacterium]
MSSLEPVFELGAARQLKEQPPAQTPASRYFAVRKQTEALVAPLTAEDQMVQSCADASPTKWHLAHTSWFFETFILAQHAPGYRPFDESFRTLFNSYYNTLGPQPEKALRNTFSRPSLDEVVAYRRHVDGHMAELLGGDVPELIAKLMELGSNHEQQHQELIVTDIKHAFWTNPLRSVYQRMPVAESSSVRTPQGQCQYAEGLREVGASPDGFSFDNELPRHKVFVPAFRLATRLVTCGEYLSFMEDHGYSRPELWLSDGWKAAQSHGWTAPLYWEKSGRQFTCTGMRKVDENEPVCHVSFYEADAFARWAGARLPTEFEWETAAAPVMPEGNLLERGKFHPQPAQKTEDNRQPLQMFGDVWEWTASAYLPYPGYKPASGALGEYNGKFMSNQMVLRGGSCITPRTHIRATYRNFFPPETRWQFSGIRLASDGV